MRVVHVHQSRAESLACRGFDVVGHDGASGSAFGPEPDERHLRNAVGEHTFAQEHFVKIVDREVDRPLGEWKILPAAEIHALHMTAHTHRKNLANSVVAETSD